MTSKFKEGDEVKLVSNKHNINYPRNLFGKKVEINLVYDRNEYPRGQAYALKGNLTPYVVYEKDLEFFNSKKGGEKMDKYEIGDVVIVREDLKHARYGGFPAMPDLQLKHNGKTSKIKNILQYSISEEEKIDIFELELEEGVWFSKGMFSNENYIEKPIVLDVLNDEIVMIDRKERKLTFSKEKIDLFKLAFEKIKAEETLLIHETDKGNIYMNKSNGYDVFFDLNGTVIEILEQDIPKYEEFLNSI